MKLQTVAEGSNLITKLQLWTSKPSSRIDVATMMLTCKYVNLIVKHCNWWQIHYWLLWIWEDKKKHTMPLRNSSTISFWFFRVWDCNPELFPAMYLVFQQLCFESNSLNRDWRTMAVMTLSTNIIHLMSFKSLCSNDA